MFPELPSLNAALIQIEQTLNKSLQLIIIVEHLVVTFSVVCIYWQMSNNIDGTPYRKAKVRAGVRDERFALNQSIVVFAVE